MPRKTTTTAIGNSRDTSGLSAHCEECGTEFTPRRQTQGRFCSRECHRTWFGKNRAAECSTKGNAVLDQLRAEGNDPRATKQAAWKRKMAFRNTALTLGDDESGDDDAWAERAAYWEAKADAARRPGRTVRRKPLSIAGHGSILRVENGSLLIRHGRTHYPQKQKEERLFPGQPTLPSVVFQVGGSGSVTFDALRWLESQSIPLVVLDYQGNIVTATGRGPTDPDLIRNQIEALEPSRAVEISRSLIREKLDASAKTLDQLALARSRSGIHRIEALRDELDSARDVDAVRLIEAQAAGVYFGSWREIRPNWSATKRKPIPPEWRRMPSRKSFLGRNRHASHPVMALLNYGYRVLESQVRIAIVTAGQDPAIGYLHANRPGRDSLVYDLMEPYRPGVDLTVLRLVAEKEFRPGDFELDRRGVCRLNPQLARLLGAVAATSGESVAANVTRFATRPPLGGASIAGPRPISASASKRPFKPSRFRQ